MLTRFSSAVLSLVFLFSASAYAATSSGRFANEAGTRSYKLYVPEAAGAKLPLLVVLHGCFMTGDNMAAGTRLNEFADKMHFAVLYPEQTYQDNVWKCWNWFKPDNQQRGTGEASIVTGMVQKLVSENNLDAAKIYVTGLSAGGAMAADLLACYSDVYAGGLIGSGLEFEAATNDQEAQSVMGSGPTRTTAATAADALKCSPPRTKPFDVIIVHGASDQFVNEVNAEQTYQQFVAIDTAIYTANGGAANTIIEQSASLPGSRHSATATTTTFGTQAKVEKVIVEGMQHGWSGGAMTTPYMQPDGIDASGLLANTFFK